MTRLVQAQTSEPSVKADWSRKSESVTRSTSQASSGLEAKAKKGEQADTARFNQAEPKLERRATAFGDYEKKMLNKHKPHYCSAVRYEKLGQVESLCRKTVQMRDSCCFRQAI